MTALSPLEQFFGGYFYQASDIYEGTPEEILESFGRHHSPMEKAEIAAHLRSLLDTCPTQDELDRQVERLGGYWPKDEVTQMRSLLERCWLEWATA